MKRISLAFFVVVLGAARLLPLEEKIKFDHVTVEKGLSQSTVTCILQDSIGFMWFGTKDGLNKYDGNTFKPFISNPDDPQSLSNSEIEAIHEDKSGILWVATRNGLNRFDPQTEKFTHYKNDPNDPNSLSHNDIRAMYEDKWGNLWIGTFGGGLNKFDPKKGTFTRYRHDPQNPNSLRSDLVRAIWGEKSGILWIGTNGGGLNKFDSQKEAFTHYRPEPGNPKSLSSNTVLSMYKDKSGILWIGTVLGLNRFDPGTETFTRYKHDPQNPNSLISDYVYSLYEDKSGNLWIGTTLGLNRLDGQRDKFYCYKHEPNDPKSLTNDYILSIYEDRSGALWIGPWGSGLNKFDRKMQKFIYYQSDPNNPTNSLSHNFVWCIFEDREGMLWIGTDGGGLNKFDPNNELFTCYKLDRQNPNSLSSDFVYSIHEDKWGMLWIGTTLGLNKFDRQKNTFTLYQEEPQNPNSLSHNYILKVYEDQSGIFWIGTFGGGLTKFEPDKEKFTRYKADANNPNSLSNNDIRTIYGDRSGTLWIGTFGGGLNEFDPKKEIFKCYKKDPDNPNSLASNEINSIYEDQRGILWIGTWGGGLNKFDRQKGIFTAYTRKDGLPNDNIYGILEDSQGNLWISTSKGLARFNPRTGSCRNYHPRDGLQGYEFNCGAYYKSKSGEMFFGGVTGFNRFYPERIEDNLYMPPIVITDFKIFNRSVGIGKNSPLKEHISYTKEIVLSYANDNISFEFAALDYTDSERNQYKYLLEGFNPDWIDLGPKHDITFTNLNAGTYTFRVIGSNNDGLWNEKGASVKIIITPPFWATWWFRILVALLCFGLFFVLHKIRTTRIKQRMERRRLEQELKLKADFTAMLVHDLRSPLSAVIGYSEMLNEMPDLVDVKKTGQVIYRSSEKMLTLINDMLDLSKFEAGKMNLEKKNVVLAEVVLETVEIMNPLFKKKEINLACELDSAAKEIILCIDMEKISQVIINFLSNAIKFAPFKGSVIVRAFEANKEFLEVSVSNNGPDVPEELREHLFDKYAQLNKGLKTKGTGLGLAVSKLIVEAHGGSIGYKPSKDGDGSTFFFKLPKKMKEIKGKELG